MSIAANHKQTFSIMGGRMGADTGEIGLLKKSMYGTRDATSNF